MGAKEGRDVVTIDFPSDFMRTGMKYDVNIKLEG